MFEQGVGDWLLASQMTIEYGTSLNVMPWCWGPDVGSRGRDRLEAELEQDGLAVVGGVHLEVADSAGTRELCAPGD